VGDGSGGHRRPVTVREATATDTATVARLMSDADVAEAVAATGYEASRALAFCHSESKDCWAVESDGRVVAVGGIVPDDPDDEALSASVWLVCTEAAADHPRDFIRTLRGHLRQLERRYGILYGYVDDRNRQRKRWIESLGFLMTMETTDESHLGLPFRLFITRTEQPQT
jgi:hypothetical protein